ncbi:MucR family transcriptional regulator [Aurantiacibacter rhizosphaerae]|uniref:Transcriptional regulator n=1 Tax=Aurantiacibacter rhizosphaerae TaxID=2691582 RepID=A0A844XFN9_9SPHN|nr:MucR family transcriptional regulator [Aurantiacibacter rhizosphaerae]MWV28472.1 transcriptional regulator [Aurantiacibacter rhizosphaerae]
MDNIETGANEMLITLTADIVTAHVANSNVDGETLPSLIQNVYGALATLGTEEAVEDRPEPAVSVRASVKNDHLVCLEDGKKMKMLKRHLMTDHGMTPEDYRERWNLPADYPMVAPDYAEKRRELAKKIGLGRKPGQKRGRKKAS